MAWIAAIYELAEVPAPNSVGISVESDFLNYALELILSAFPGTDVNVKQRVNRDGIRTPGDFNTSLNCTHYLSLSLCSANGCHAQQVYHQRTAWRRSRSGQRHSSGTANSRTMGSE